MVPPDIAIITFPYVHLNNFIYFLLDIERKIKEAQQHTQNRLSKA